MYHAADYYWVKKQCEVMALFQEEPNNYLIELDDLLLKNKNLKRKDIQTLVDERFEQRKKTDVKKSDEIRDLLKLMVVQVQDSQPESVWDVEQ